MDGEEDCCQSDALLVDVVQQGKSDRQAIRSVECDPEKAWLDGYVAGWFKGYFQPSSREDTLKEERVDEQSYQVLSQ